MVERSVLPVSLVVPTRDRPPLLRATVAGVLGGDHLPAQLVIAEQSSAPTDDVPTDPRVRLDYLHLDTVGLSRARNAGIAAADQPIVAFLDDDIVPETGWLRAIHDSLVEAGDRSVVTGRVVAVEGHAGLVPSCSPWTEAAEFAGRQYADPLAPGNMAIRRGAFDEIGMFDERLGAGTRYPSSEDNDFGMRLLDAGYRIRQEPDAIGVHHGIREGREIFRIDWGYGKGQGAFYAKHDRPGDRHTRARLRRNARYRLRSMRRGLRGPDGAVHQAVYLAGMLTGYATWRLGIGETG